MDIPLELWRLIAYELQIRKDRQSLLSLCLASTTMNKNITPILYNHVDLPTAVSVELFARTIINSAFGLIPYIGTLTIGGYLNYRQWDRIQFSYSTAENLSLMLKSMSNLRELTIATMAMDFSLCFDPLALKPAFSLHKLVMPLMGTASFYKFLQSQQSITEIHIGTEHTMGEVHFGLCLYQQPELLPNLTSIAAPISVLKGAVPGRPVSEIMIVTDLLDWTDPGVTIFSPSTWEPILCGSRAPIRTVRLYQSSHSSDPWDQLVPALKQFSVHETLERVKIRESLDPPVTELGKRDSLSERVAQMKMLKGFNKLESLEFGEMLHTPSPTTDVLCWLGNMSSLNAWKAYLPSLKYVKMYEVNVP